jgi:hypothetical protein
MVLASQLNIYEINNWIELFDNYEQLNSIKLCSNCWGDKVKVFNYFRNMKKETKSENTGEQTYQFIAGFEGTEIFIKGFPETISQANLNENIELIKLHEDLMKLIELV